MSENFGEIFEEPRRAGFSLLKPDSPSVPPFSSEVIVDLDFKVGAPRSPALLGDCFQFRSLSIEIIWYKQTIDQYDVLT